MALTKVSLRQLPNAPLNDTQFEQNEETLELSIKEISYLIPLIRLIAKEEIAAASGVDPNLSTPGAPTNFVVDDVANTANFTYSSASSTASAYEYQINGGSITTLSAKPFSVGNIEAAIGAVKVRVKAVAGVSNPSAWLSNGIAYTITPAAPTNGVVNDTANTFGYTNNPNFTNLSDYEYQINGGSITTVPSNPIPVGNINAAIDQVRVRVKAVGGANASDWLSNTTAFTSTLTTPSAPTSFVVDDTANTANFTYTSGYTNPSDYEYDINGGAITTLTVKPLVVGDINAAIGQVRIRVKAVAGVSNASNWLTNPTAYTSTGGDDLATGYSRVTLNPTLFDTSNGKDYTQKTNTTTLQTGLRMLSSGGFITKIDTTTHPIAFYLTSEDHFSGTYFGWYEDSGRWYTDDTVDGPLQVDTFGNGYYIAIIKEANGDVVLKAGLNKDALSVIKNFGVQAVTYVVGEGYGDIGANAKDVQGKGITTG